jgi:1-phosphatidylinositol-3-phosphate 5-kinase
MSQRQFPGAFPQAAGYIPERDATPSPKPPILPPLPGGGSSVNVLVKPVICLHFPAPPPPVVSTSTSTLHLKRQVSSGGASSTGSIGSTRANWWASKSGSGKKGSEMTITPDMEVNSSIEVEYIHGRFALPSVRIDSGRKGKDKAVSDDEGESGGASDSATETLSTEDEGTSSAWSGTQRAGSKVANRQASSIILAGLKNDIPRVKEGEQSVRVVGGTLIIRGINRDEERQALEKVLKALVSHHLFYFDHADNSSCLQFKRCSQSWNSSTLSGSLENWIPHQYPPNRSSLPNRSILTAERLVRE